MKAFRSRRGFTLIELVIVVAIIGILALMIIPQFNSAVDESKLQTFQHNCFTVTYGIATYQSAHNGDMPADQAALEPYINGGWASLKGPTGATYEYEAGSFIGTYEGADEPFTYPTDVEE